MTAVSTITTEVQLANLALRKLKSRLVLTALPGTTAEGALIYEALAAARNSVLQAVDWPFARRKAELVATEDLSAAECDLSAVAALDETYTDDGEAWTLTGDLDTAAALQVTFRAGYYTTGPVTDYFLGFSINSSVAARTAPGEFTSPPAAPPFQVDLGTLVGLHSLEDVTTLDGLLLDCTAGDPWTDLALKAWGFTASYTAGEVATSDWAYGFLLPSDCIAPRSIFGVRNPRADQRVPYELEHSAELGDTVLRCDIEEPILTYTKEITDPALFSPLFVEALAWRLAADCALPLTGDAQAALAAEQMAERALAQARAAAFNENREEQPPDSPATASRL